MATLGFIFCFLILICFTLWIVFAFWGTIMLTGKLSSGEGIFCLVLAVLDIYLWICLFDNSPFVLVTR